MRADQTERRGGQRRLLYLEAAFGVALLAALLAFPAGAQQAGTASVGGRVSDVAGAAVADVAVTLVPAGSAAARTVLTDRFGNYRFVGLAAGGYELRAHRLGLTPLRRDLTLAAGETRTLDLVMAMDTIALEGIVAEGRREVERERARFETDPGVTARVVEAQTLKVLPGLGEADVLRAVSLLPGVISTSDFSSSYNVRGGSADQNLIMIDGFTVFNPFHLGGLFSVFNSDAVERAELFAGGFGAEFGGRVSSVLNIESRADVPDGFEVHGGVSMLASRVLLRSPLPDFAPRALGGERGAWFVSARRSYFDQLLRPITDFPYHLTDVQGFATVGTRDGGSLSFTAYRGEDVLDLSSFGLDAEGGAADVLRIRWNWGNRVLGARLRQPLSRGWMLDTRVGYSRFAESLGFVDFGDVDFRSRIDQWIWGGDLARDLTPDLSLRTGLSADRIEYANTAEAGGTSFLDLTGDGVLGAGYASLRWRPGAWIVEPGVRYDVWAADDTTRAVLSPRFAVKRFLGADQNLAVKLAVGRYSQFLHSLRDEELPISNDTWVLASRSIPPVVSDQVQLGLESFWGAGWSASVEAYGRTFDGVTEFNPAEDPNDPADDLLAGRGHSYGLDLQLRRAEGRLSGWAAVSLLRARRTFPDPLAAGWDDLPQEVTYPPIFDRTFNADLVLQYDTPGGMELGARWNFGSGLPYTRPVAQHFAWRHHPIWGRAEPFNIGVEREGVPVGVVLGPRNAERYPNYHRLDLTARRSYERGWGTVVPYLQVLNVYNRRNVLFYFYDYNRETPVRSGFSMFPFLPAIGVEASF